MANKKDIVRAQDETRYLCSKVLDKVREDLWSDILDKVCENTIDPGMGHQLLKVLDDFKSRACTEMVMEVLREQRKSN